MARKEIVVEIKDLERIQARPGDRFVYRPAPGTYITNLEAAKLVELWQRFLPENPLFILAPGGDVFAVSEPDVVVVDHGRAGEIERLVREVTDDLGRAAARNGGNPHLR